MRQIVHDELPIVKALLLETLKVSEYRSIERLGGMTNHTYKVELWNGDMYVVRIPGAGTEKLIDRAAEKISALLACRLGIDAQIISFGEGGEKVSAYIQGAITLKEDDFSNPEMLEKVAAVFRKLHDSGADTGVSFDFFDMVSRYESNIQAAELKLFDDYEETKTQIIRLKAYIDKHAICRYVPCHNDPLCENWVMDSNGKLHLIDWEYAGMSYPEGLDRYHFWMQTAIHEKHWGAEELRRYMCSAEGAWIDREVLEMYVLDVMSKYVMREGEKVKSLGAFEVWGMVNRY